VADVRAPSKDLENRTEPDYADAIEPAGHFRIYLGAARVGKTYSMLSEGAAGTNGAPTW